MRRCLCIYCLHWDNDVTSWGRTIHRILWLEVFLDSRLQYESLEGVMDFLAFLVQKLWKNKQKIIGEIPTNSLGNPYKIWGLMALTWAPETVGSRSRPLKHWFPTGEEFLPRGEFHEFREGFPLCSWVTYSVYSKCCTSFFQLALALSISYITLYL